MEATPWKHELFFSGFKPTHFGLFILKEIKKRADNDWHFIFEPNYEAVGAPKEDVRFNIYGSWREDTGLLSFTEFIETEMPIGAFPGTVSLINATLNVPDGKYLSKGCIVPPQSEDETEPMRIACGWHIGLYEEHTRSEEFMESLRRLCLSNMIRQFNETARLTVDLHMAYYKDVPRS